MIGNHDPKFAYEADLKNLKVVIVRLSIPCPVGKTMKARPGELSATVIGLTCI